MRDPLLRAALGFVLSAGAIAWAGTSLSRSGDLLATRAGLGRVWVGAVLVAGATSLPEILTDVHAALLGAPDLAVGDLFGSSMANMLILALVDLLQPTARLWQRVALTQSLLAGLGVSLTGLAGLFTLARLPWAVGGVGWDSALIASAYLAGMRVVYRHEQGPRGDPAGAARGAGGRGSVGRPGILFALAALVIAVAAPWLARSARDLADLTGLGTAFVGVSLLAVTTSFPEFVVSLAAVRLGAADLAVGNLFGSNAFNMAVLVVADVAYRPGPLLASVAPAQAMAALLGIVLMALGVMALVSRAERRRSPVEPWSLLMVIVYGLGMGLLYRLGVAP